MAMNTSPAFTHTVNNGVSTIVNADSTNLKTLVTADADGTCVRAISITSDDTSDRNIKLWITSGGTDYLIGNIPVVDGAGSNGTDPAVDGMNTTYLPWIKNGVIVLESGEVLKASVAVAVTAAKCIYIRVEAGDY